MSQRPTRSQTIWAIGALFGNRVLSIALPFVTFPIVVRSLSPSQYGDWVYAQTCIAFCALVSNPGLTQFAGREVSRDESAGALLLPRIRALQVTLACVAYGCLSLYVVLSTGRRDLQFTMFVLGLSIVTTALIGSDWLLASLRAFRVQATCATIGQIVFAIAIVTLVGFAKWSPALPVFTVVSGLSSAIIAWMYLAKTHGFLPTMSVCPHEWIGFLRTSVFYGAASFLSLIYQRFDFVLVERWYGNNVLGHYSANYRLAEILQSFLLIGTTMMTPRAAKLFGLDNTGLSLLLRDCITVAVIVVAPLVVGGTTCSQGIVDLCLGEEYSTDALLLSFLLWMLPAGVAAAMFSGCCLYAAGCAKRFLCAIASAAAINIVLNLILLSRYGVFGAALATIAAQLTVALSSYLMSPQRVTGILAPEASLPLIAVLVMWLAVKGAQYFGGNLLLQIVVGAATYLGVLVLLNSVSKGSLWKAINNAENWLR